ncbi:MAG TPA: hypothetical protein VMR62_18680, partial [Bryobacteraceae bacterium]|nr:hypothetical protein [Bryobacteraceae bacterium]
RHVSAAHAGDLVIAVAGGSVAGCDLEFVATRPPELWRDLLGADGFDLADLIARESGEDLNISATRVWCAVECLKKGGAAGDRPLVLRAARPDGWIELASGAARVPTYRADHLAFAIMIES